MRCELVQNIASHGFCLKCSARFCVFVVNGRCPPSKRRASQIVQTIVRSGASRQGEAPTEGLNKVGQSWKESSAALHLARPLRPRDERSLRCADRSMVRRWTALPFQFCQSALGPPQELGARTTLQEWTLRQPRRRHEERCHIPINSAAKIALEVLQQQTDGADMPNSLESWCRRGDLNPHDG